MKRIFRRILSVALALVFTFSLCVGANAQEETKRATILFTHDLHSHLLPSADENGGEYGGYARLMTVIKEQKERYPDAVLVDGGDFSMGSLFQTAFETSAIELRMMGAMGYDATTFGNHEFDYLPEGLANMLDRAKESGDRLPAIVEANYYPPREGEDMYDDTSAMMWEALENYGVKDYIIIERGGVSFVIFGIMGIVSDSYAPNSGMILEDAAERAQAVVDDATAYCVEKYGREPIVICLSHSGTYDGEGEDYDLAKNVKGIDVIVSGHSHATISEPIVVNDTYIVSAGEYGKYLGVVQMDVNSNGGAELVGYELISIDESIEDDEETTALIESFKEAVERDYLGKYDMTFDEVLLNNPYRFDKVDDLYSEQRESSLGNLFADSYKWAAEKELGVEVDLALTAAGVIRESLPVRSVSVSDVFNAASLGVGTEGELIAAYVTGKDLKNILEVDASIQPLMKTAQLYCSGVEYSFNTKRMIFNKVDNACLRRDDGTAEKIVDDELYLIVTGMYVGQMLGAVEEKSFGLMEVTPRDKNGKPIEVDELVNYVIHDSEGNPVKEWYAIASYLKEMNGEMDEGYAATDGRKVVYSSFSPVKLLSNANKFTYAAAALIIIIILAVIIIIRKIRRIKGR